MYSKVKKYLSDVPWLKVGKVCYWSLIGLIALIALLVIISVLPLPGDHKLYVVRSGSMSPVLEAGDLIFTKKTGSYEKGDIVTFLPPDTNKKSESVTHRIVETEQENGAVAYTTKGDANQSIDGSQISPDRVLGEYQFRIPLVGYPIGYAKTLPGLVVLIIVPAVVTIYDEIHKLREEIRSRREKKNESKSKD
jgi:signal peptidase